MIDWEASLSEEIGLVLAQDDARHLAAILHPQRTSPTIIVVAEIFHVRMRHDPATQSEIEEAIWVDHLAATALPWHL